MQHTIPTTPLGVLQAILMQATLANEPEATFKLAEPEPESEPRNWVDGHYE